MRCCGHSYALFLTDVPTDQHVPFVQRFRADRRGRGEHDVNGFKNEREKRNPMSHHACYTSTDDSDSSVSRRFANINVPRSTVVLAINRPRRLQRLVNARPRRYGIVFRKNACDDISAYRPRVCRATRGVFAADAGRGNIVVVHAVAFNPERFKRFANK